MRQRQQAIRAPRAKGKSTPKSAPSRHQVGTKSAPSRRDSSASSSIDPVTDPVKRSSRAIQSSDPVERLLMALLQSEQSSGGLRKTLHVKHRPTFRKNYLHPAIKAGLIEPTIPDKPNSRLQRYRLTDKGHTWLATAEDRKREEVRR